MDKIPVAIYYNGGFPRHHMISKAFYERLIQFLGSHKKADIIIVRLDGGK